MTDLHTDSNRLWSRLMDMAEVGATPAGGSNRQASPTTTRPAGSCSLAGLIEPDAAGRGAEVLLHATLDLAGTAS